LTDHVPISFCFRVFISKSLLTQHEYNQANVVRDYRWDKGSTDKYYYDTGNYLSRIQHCFTCEESDNLCNDASHVLDIGIYYNEMIHILKTCADLHIPMVPKSAMKHYWSVALDDLKSRKY